jgi:hypothetical protein
MNRSRIWRFNFVFLYSLRKLALDGGRDVNNADSTHSMTACKFFLERLIYITSIN